MQSFNTVLLSSPSLDNIVSNNSATTDSSAINNIASINFRASNAVLFPVFLNDWSTNLISTF